MSRRLAALLAHLNHAHRRQQTDGLTRLLNAVNDTQPGRCEPARRVCEALWALPARRTP